MTQTPHNSALVPPGHSRAGYNHALVLAPSPSPTLEYYSSHVADKVPSGNIETCYASRPCVKRPKLQPGTWVVIFRHAHPSWLRFILSRREELSRVTWFLDDDIPAMLWQRSLPTVYVWKSYVRYLHVKVLLAGRGTDYAFSTEELASRFPNLPREVWSPRRVDPPARELPLLYFYHATSSHHAELAWLAPIVGEVQRRVPEAWFELFADRTGREIFRSVPRTRCIHPMVWADFLRYTSTFKADVGLAPLLDTAFNRARAPVKFFDIARTGAAGIFSESQTFKGTVRDGVNGLLLPNEPERWVEAIIRLLQSPAERLSLATQASRDCGTASEK